MSTATGHEALLAGGVSSANWSRRPPYEYLRAAIGAVWPLSRPARSSRPQEAIGHAQELALVLQEEAVGGVAVHAEPCVTGTPATGRSCRPSTSPARRPFGVEARG